MVILSTFMEKVCLDSCIIIMRFCTGNPQTGAYSILFSKHSKMSRGYSLSGTGHGVEVAQQAGFELATSYHSLEFESLDHYAMGNPKHSL